MTADSPTQIDPATYETWRRSILGRTTDALEHDLLFDLIGDVTGRTILEVGCGDGGLAVELWKRRANITGIDASTRMIEVARGRARQHGADVAFHVATAQSLPFPTDTFDCVIAVTVLCFIEDGAATLREMGRVLRPGGRVVIGELGKWNIWAAERRIRGWLGNPVWHHARFRSARELRDLAEEAGVVVETVQGAIYYPPCGFAARLLGSVDRDISRLTTFGAAFLALAVTKPTND